MHLLLLTLREEARLAVSFAIASSLKYSAPEGARRLRLITYPRVVLGGLLARLYHRLRVPFEWTPLVSLPFLFAGAYCLYSGWIWAGVLLSGVHVVNDAADGLAMGWAVDGLTPKPAARMRLRRFLDSYVADVTARFALYLVFVLRLQEAQAIHPMLLMLLTLVEIASAMIGSGAEIDHRRLEFHYDFVLDRASARRLFGRGYGAKVLLGQATAYHNYALLPLVGYWLPLASAPRLYFAIVLAVRLGALGVRLAQARAEALAPAQGEPSPHPA
jgi:hypothetical protein